MRIGVLALQGDVREHVQCAIRAAKNLKIEIQVREVRTKKDLEGLSGLIIPGGESTVLQKLLVREEMFESISKIPNVFGTCAGIILMAKNITDGMEGQQSLGLLDLEVQRNAYGPQGESFETELETKIGKVRAAFIRAPLIKKIGKEVEVLASLNGHPVAVSQSGKGRFILGLTFHPEIEGETKFHELFLGRITTR